MTILAALMFAAMSEIKVDLKLDHTDFVVGERMRGVVNVMNSSPDKISCGYANSEDLLIVEVFTAQQRERLDKISRGPFVAEFSVKSGEGQKLEVFLDRHFALDKPRRYLVKPVLVHAGIRYEGQLRAFDVVEGVRLGGAMQMFKNRPGLQREFELVYWSRDRREHLFIKAQDTGKSNYRQRTYDLGVILRIDKPAISVLSGGEVVVLHRLNQDQFVRSEIWSLPDTFTLRKRDSVQDPETAGTQRVRELYREGGVKPKENPWWKFW